MTRPRDIPEDIWTKAGGIINGTGNWREDLSRLILAERERCAALAESPYHRARAGLAVPSAIRAGDTHE